MEEKSLSKYDQTKTHSIKGIFEKNAEGTDLFAGIILDGQKLMPTNITKELAVTLTTVIKDLTGISDVDEGLDFLIKSVNTLIGSDSQQKFQNLVSFLQEMKPTDAIEAKLLAQFLILNDRANSLMRNGAKADMMCHGDYYYKYGLKAMNLSQQTIQTLIKYKSKGTQQVNVVHIHDNSKAIIANNIEGVGK